MNLRKFLFLPLMMMTITACGPAQTCVVREGTQVNDLLPTPITDSFKLAQKDQLEGKRFAGNVGEQYDHIGYVQLRSCTDGDTANFTQNDYRDEQNALITIKTRFLGVNTPESTAKVQPWGKKASLWCKHVLESAQADAEAHSTSGNKVSNIVLINHPKNEDGTGGPFEEKDSSGGRWLAFIWYRPTYESDWRLLNLELVEQAYSRNYLFDEDDVCNYKGVFEKADKWNEKCGYRVYGELDPDYDYEETPYEYSIWYIKHHYDELGITDAGKSGKQLIVTALLVGMQGDNMILRDLYLDHEQVEANDTEYSGIYAYVGFNANLGNYIGNAHEQMGGDRSGIGLVVRFYCRATQYGGNYQLTDVNTSTISYEKRSFRILKDETAFNKYKNELAWSEDYFQHGDVAWADRNTNDTPIRMEPTSISSMEDLGSHQYQFVETEVVVRKVTVQEDEQDEDSSGSSQEYWYKYGTGQGTLPYTVYVYIAGPNNKKTYCSLRIDGSLSPYIEPATFGTSNPTDFTSADSPVGKTFHITGYVSAYFDKYQFLLPDNTYGRNFFYKVS